MNRRGAGIALIGISAFLVGIRALSATAYVGRVSGLFNIDIQVAMPVVKNFAVISLIAGLAYLFWAEIEAFVDSRRR